MVRPTKGRSAEFDVIIDEFEVLPEDDFGNLRLDIEGDFDNEIAIFPGAIENFQGLFSVNSGDDLSGTNLDFQFESIHIGRGEEAITDVGIPNPITLDLVARKTETDLFGNIYPSVEYSFIGGGLTAFGIYESSLILLDADADESNGFQVVLDSNGISIGDSDFALPGFQFSGADGTTKTISSLGDLEPDTDPDSISADEQIVEEEGLTIFEIDPIAAVNDIRYITGKDERLPVSPLLLADVSRVSGPSASEPTVVVNNIGSFTEQGVIIEAEDLNLDGVYQVETIGSGDDSFDVIGLRDSSDAGAIVVTGEASFIVGPEQASDNSSLTVSTFDEGDGVGTIQVQKNGNPIEIFDDGDFKEFVTLNETTDPNLDIPSEDIRQEFTFSIGEIEAGDELIIQGTSNEQEFVRLDFVTLEGGFF